MERFELPSLASQIVELPEMVQYDFYNITHELVLMNVFNLNSVKL